LPEGAIGIAEARQLVAPIEQPVLAPPEFIGHEGGDEINRRHLFRLRLVETCFQDGSHAREAELAQRAIEFDQIHDGSPVVRSIRSR
jgi:hypothetical protein